MNSRSVGALLLFALAVLAWLRPASPDLVAVSDPAFSYWRYGIENERGLYEDQTEIIPLAAGTDLEFFAGVTRGRLVPVSGAAWDEVFAGVAGLADHDRDDLARELRRRTSEAEDYRPQFLWYRLDEAPFASLSPPPGRGETVFVHRGAAAPESTLALFRPPEGEVSGSRFGYRFQRSRWSVPASYLHPWRAAAGWLAAAGVLVLFSGLLGRGLRALRPSGGDRVVDVPNGRLRAARISLAVALLGAAGVLLAPWYVTGMEAYAILFLSLVAGLTAFVLAVVFGRSGARLERMLRGEALLAHWRYGEEEWRRFLGEEREEERGRRRGLLVLIGIMMAVIGVIIAASGGWEEAGTFFAILGGVYAVIVVAALLAGRRRESVLARGPAEALVARDGVWLAGEYHDFRIFGTSREGADLEETEDGGFLLVVRYTYWTGRAVVPVEVRVPVPPGREAEAEAALIDLQP